MRKHPVRVVGASGSVVVRERVAHQPAGRTAVLLDLENIAHDRDGWVDEREFERRMCLVDRHLADADYVAAACAGHILKRYLRSFITRGLHVELVPGSPDAADQALLDHADFLHQHGYDRAIVISGDHCFACLAEHFELTVIAMPDRLSGDLARRADHLVTLTTRRPRPTRTRTAPPRATTARSRVGRRPRQQTTTRTPSAAQSRSTWS